MSSIFRGLQTDVADQLARAPFFWGNNITVLTPLQKDVDSQISETIARLGLCALVAVPTASSKSPDSQTFFDDVEVIVLCIENRTINATPTVTAEEMAEVAACWLQHYQTSNLGEALAVRRIEDLLPEKDDPSVDVRLVAVTFGTTACLSYSVTTTAAPTITQGATTISMTGAAGVTIRYTTDGTTPDQNSTAYSAPIAKPDVATVIKAKSFKSGEASSTTTTHTVT